MVERFSDIEKPLLTNQPSLEERLKQYPELKGKIEAMLAIIENAGGDVEKAAKRGGGLSRNCGRWGAMFSTVGPALSSRKKNKSTTPSRA
jgi:hypothetical protein